MTTEEILKIEFESIKDDMISLYDSKGMRASGDFADSLEVETSKNSVKLLGNKYAEQLEYGRKSGKQPPIAVIKQWIIDKGIVNKIKGDISVSSLAFLIARKIGKEGWKRKRFGGVELVTKIVTPERMQSIIDKVGQEAIISVTDTLVKELKQLQAV